MPKQRAPISTRLRNKDKSGARITLTQDTPSENVKKENLESTTNNSLEDITLFSPRVDTDIYLDELQSPLSFVRGTDEEKAQFVKDEDEAMSQCFGSDYKSSLNTSSFYCARISAPVPSKRTKRPKLSPSPDDRPSSIRGSISKLKLPFPTIRKTKSRSISPSASSTAPAGNMASASRTKKKSTTNTNNSSLDTNNQQQVLKENQQKANSHTNCDAQTDFEIKGNPILVPLPQCKKLPVYIKMDAKDKEREYWRRQRRVFVHSRFLTNEEGVAVAKTVYSNLSINPTNRMVISMQGNIANFRTKLRRLFISQAERFNITTEYIKNTKEDEMICQLTSKMNDSILKSIWEHWIADPFVDVNKFYMDRASVNLLRDVTVKLMIIHFKEQYNVLSPKQARTEMKKLDLISRTIPLPDLSE